MLGGFSNKKHENATMHQNDGEYVLTKYPKTRERTSTVTFQVLELGAGRGRKGKLCLAMEENRTVYYSAAPLWTYLQC